MQKLAAVVAVLALGAPCATTSIVAQEIEHGTWTGALTPPGGEPIAVTLRVGDQDGALSIVMNSLNDGDIDLNDERLEGDELTFWFEPGERVDCTLTRQDDGSFEGVCADQRGSDGGEGTLAMVPPSA